MNRALLIHSGDHDLVGHVAGLDEVPLVVGVCGQDVEPGAHHGVSARAESAVEGGDLQTHSLTGIGNPGEGFVGDGAQLRAGRQCESARRRPGHAHVQLGALPARRPPPAPCCQNLAIAPHHGRTVPVDGIAGGADGCWGE